MPSGSVIAYYLHFRVWYNPSAAAVCTSFHLTTISLKHCLHLYGLPFHWKFSKIILHNVQHYSNYFGKILPLKVM